MKVYCYWAEPINKAADHILRSGPPPVVRYPKNPPTLTRGILGDSNPFVRIGSELIGKPTLRAKRLAVENGQDPDSATSPKRYRSLKFRTSDVGQWSEWVELYTLIHRPLPDARLEWVGLSYAGRRWELHIAVDMVMR